MKFLFILFLFLFIVIAFFFTLDSFWKYSNYIIKILRPWDSDEEVRHPVAHKKGGLYCDDKDVVSKLRSIGKEMIKLIGKKVLSGSLSLTKISFPIKSMIPKSALETAVHQSNFQFFILWKITIKKIFL